MLIGCRWQRHWFVVDHTSFRVRETRLAEGEDDYAAVADGEPDAVEELQRFEYRFYIFIYVVIFYSTFW